MSRAPSANLDFAGLEAEKLVREEGPSALPVCPKAIAASRDIVVSSKDGVAGGVSGMLLRHGNEFAIAYASCPGNPGFENFSIGHELGHYFLAGHPERLFAGGVRIHMSRAGFVCDDPIEAEADRFAAGLLMPSHLFDIALRRAGEGIEAVLALASLCGTSLTATAIRYVQRTKVPAAVVMSTEGRVDFCVVSSAFQDFDGLVRPRKGELLPGETATERFARDIANVAHGRQGNASIDLKDWFGGRRRTFEEEFIGLGSYGKVLTVLTGEADDDDPDDDEALGES